MNKKKSTLDPEKGELALIRLYCEYNNESPSKAFVRNNLGMILELKSRKIPLHAIHETLRKSGLQIKERTLKSYIYEMTHGNFSRT
jgi:hypothetical protein